MRGTVPRSCLAGGPTERGEFPSLIQFSSLYHQLPGYIKYKILSKFTKTSQQKHKTSKSSKDTIMPSHIDAESTLETIEVMLRQEENGYQVFDYLGQLPASAPLDTPVDAPVDALCRSAMAKWCNDITDFCNYSRETAAIAMSCLDRFMASPDGRSILLDRNLFQLAAMTALYTAVKVHEHEAMDPQLVSSLCRGAHSPEDIEAMESRMLNAIQWRINPPTAMSFLRSMLDLVPEHLIDASQRETVMELTQFQVDLAVCDDEFWQQPASSIAFASLLNAVESVTTDGLFFENFEATMSKATRVNLEGLRDMRIALYEAVNGNDDMDMQLTSSCDDSKSLEFGNSSETSFHSSPRAVNT
jgi:hypothetical protein